MSVFYNADVIISRLVAANLRHLSRVLRSSFCRLLPDLDELMSRRSIRLKRGRTGRDSTQLDEPEIITTFSRKRKAEDLDNDTAITKRRREFLIKNQFVPICTSLNIPSSSSSPVDLAPSFSAVAIKSPSKPESSAYTPECSGILTPSSTTPPRALIAAQCRVRTPHSILRLSPLPNFPWADSAEVWQVMLNNENKYFRSPQLLDRHPSLEIRMRAILVDWLIEVSEVYKLQRETFFLAVDFADRYLSATRDVHKHQLQLIGIAALFIASKLEEIYPPKLREFAYVTDGACEESEILDQELVMLKALNWDLAPITMNAWINVYLQLVNWDLSEEKPNISTFEVPQYSSSAYITISRLLDLCIHDIQCLKYSYSVVATCALYHCSSQYVALSVSGYRWEDIAECADWMAPFAMILREEDPVTVQRFKGVPDEDSHYIQTHVTDLYLLERAHLRSDEIARAKRTSPDPGYLTMTPPSSKEKSPTQ